MAIPKIAVGDIVQVIIEGVCENQRTLNVLHYKAAVGLPETEYFVALQELCEAVGENPTTGIVPKMLPLMGPNARIQRIQAQRVYPQRDLYTRLEIDQGGEHVDDCDATNVAAVITKRGEHVGRGKSGTFHLGGLANTTYALGNITGPATALLVDLADKLNDPQMTSGAEPVFKPGLFNPTAGAGSNWNEIVATDPMKTLRVMRRRTVGVGE